MPGKPPSQPKPRSPAERALKESPELKRTQVRGDGRSQGAEPYREEASGAADANLAGPRAEGRVPARGRRRP
jgi:hypothetical protein